MRLTHGSLVLFAALVPFSPAVLAPASAAVTQLEAFAFLFGNATLRSQDANGNGPAGAVAFNFFESTADFATTPTLTANRTGTVFDTATGATAVASATVNSTLTGTNSAGGGQFTATSLLSDSASTNTLANYQPAGVLPNSTTNFRSGPTVNVGLTYVVSGTGAPYTLTIALADVVRSASLSANIVFDPDANNDGIGDGNFQPIVSTGTIFQNGSTTIDGFLAPGVGFYRVTFIGGASDFLNTDNATSASSARFTTAFTVVPEPAALTCLALPLALLRRRR